MHRMRSVWLLLTTSLFSVQLQAQVVNTFGDWMPVNLETDTTVIYLADYFEKPTMVTGVEAPPRMQARLDPLKQQVTIVPGQDIPPLSVLTFHTGEQEWSLVLRRSKKEEVSFIFNPGGVAYLDVSLAGDMNSWNPDATPLEYHNGQWQTRLWLNPGRYQYQIVADTSWMLDPNNPVQVPNGIGGINSLLVVGDTSFAGRPYFYLDKTEDNKIVIGSENRNALDPVFVLINNHLIPFSEGTSLSFVMPEEMAGQPEGSIRVFGYNEVNEGNDMMIPVSFGKVVEDAALINRHDFHKAIVYFLLVDRFYNGDKTNDAPVDDPRVDPKANYMGGDLAGVQMKLRDGYFTNMGFNTLWLSPVMQNPHVAYQEYPEPHRWFSGYHGYWPISLSQVDDRFGTNTQYKALIDSLHKENMNIVFDYIANHVHAEHPLWTEHPDWFTPLELPDGRKNLRLWDEQRLSTWFEPYMPSLDHSQPQVAEASADSAMWWLRNYDIDGFRHDATKHIETEFWRLLTEKIHQESLRPGGYPVYQIGETFGSRELIGSYLGSGLLNAQFDFNLFFDARNILAEDEGSFRDLSLSLHLSFDYYGYHHLMGNITGNHDLARFISYAGGALSLSEDDKAAGWERAIEVQDPRGYKKLELLHVFNMTIPGIPIVYYGDEIGMPGAGDPDNRRMMRFEGLTQPEQHVKLTVRQLAKMRASHMALLYGDFHELYVDDQVWVYARTYLDDQVIVCLNKGYNAATVDLELPAYLNGFIGSGKQDGQNQQQEQQNQQQGESTEGGMSILGNTLQISVPPYGYQILFSH